LNFANSKGFEGGTTMPTEITERLFKFNCELAYILAQTKKPTLNSEILARLRSLIEAVEQLQQDLNAETESHQPLTTNH
jgi:hypothetical protein